MKTKFQHFLYMIPEHNFVREANVNNNRFNIELRFPTFKLFLFLGQFFHTWRKRINYEGTERWYTEFKLFIGLCAQGVHRYNSFKSTYWELMNIREFCNQWIRKELWACLWWCCWTQLKICRYINIRFLWMSLIVGMLLLSGLVVFLWENLLESNAGDCKLQDGFVRCGEHN